MTPFDELPGGLARAGCRAGERGALRRPHPPRGHGVLERPDGRLRVGAFAEGTKAVAEAVAAVDGYTVVGGGDSVRAITELGLDDEVSGSRRAAAPRSSCSRARSSRAWPRSRRKAPAGRSTCDAAVERPGVSGSTRVRSPDGRAGARRLERLRGRAPSHLVGRAWCGGRSIRWFGGTGQPPGICEVPLELHPPRRRPGRGLRPGRRRRHEQGCRGGAPARCRRLPDRRRDRVRRSTCGVGQRWTGARWRGRARSSWTRAGIRCRSSRTTTTGTGRATDRRLRRAVRPEPGDEPRAGRRGSDPRRADHRRGRRRRRRRRSGLEFGALRGRDRATATRSRARDDRRHPPGGRPSGRVAGEPASAAVWRWRAVAHPQRTQRSGSWPGRRSARRFGSGSSARLMGRRTVLAKPAD